MPTAIVRNIRMRWEERGDGAAVILLHGIPTSPALWRKVMPMIRDARVIAWEMIGYGESIPQGRDRDIGVARQAQYLRAWMDEQGIEDAVIVGHNLGGGVAQNLAVDAPERVSGLVLANSISYDSWPIPPVKAVRAMGGVVKRLPDTLFEPALTSLIRLGHDDAEVARESAELHWRPYETHGAADSFVRQARSLDVRDTLRIADQLRTLRVPARVVWGTEDTFQRVRYGERLAWDLDTTLDRIEGAKHFIPEDHPDRVVKAIQDVHDRREAARVSPTRRAAPAVFGSDAV